MKSRVKTKQKSRRDVTKYISKPSKRYRYTKKPLRDCIKRSVLPLRFSDKSRSIYGYTTWVGGSYGTGTGKTLTAVATSQCYLDKNPNNGVIFIGPTSLLSNFEEIDAYGDDDMSNYEFYSFTTFYNRRRLIIMVRGALLILVSSLETDS